MQIYSSLHILHNINVYLIGESRAYLYNMVSYIFADLANIIIVALTE